MAKWVLLCPKCHKVSKGEDWTVTFDAVEQASVKLTENGCWDIEHPEVVDREISHIEHECGFTTYEWDAGDFAVLLDGNRVKDYGGYWETFREDLEKIAQEKGWIIDVED